MTQTETTAEPLLPAGPRLNYYWVLSPSGMDCRKGGQSQAVLAQMWESEFATEVHDQTLMEVTREINAILAEAAQHAPEPHLELSLIEFQGQYMLAWSNTIRDGLSEDDDPREVARALRLRRDDPDYPGER